MASLVPNNPFWGLEMFNQAMDTRSAQRRQMEQDKIGNRRNALAEQLQQAQIDEIIRANAARTATQGAQGEIYANTDYLTRDPNMFQQRAAELAGEAGRTRPGADMNALMQTAQQFKPVISDQFTLSEGQTRYGADGQPIASVAKQKPEEWQDWGYGQKREKNTGRTVKVPTPPRSGYQLDPDTGEVVPAPASKPMPAAALKMQQEEVDALSLSQNSKADLGAIRRQIATGQLDLGLFTNWVNRGRNLAGASTPQSRNFATFQASLEKLRNDSLRLNKGVQTEGDAQRAWNEVLANINDPKLVEQRLMEIEAINERAANLRRMNIDEIRRNYRQPQLDTTAQSNPIPAVGRGSTKTWDGAPSTGGYKNATDYLGKFGGQ